MEQLRKKFFKKEYIKNNKEYIFQLGYKKNDKKDLSLPTKKELSYNKGKRNFHNYGCMTIEQKQNFMDLERDPLFESKKEYKKRIKKKNKCLLVKEARMDYYSKWRKDKIHDNLITQSTNYKDGDYEYRIMLPTFAPSNIYNRNKGIKCSDYIPYSGNVIHNKFRTIKKTIIKKEKFKTIKYNALIYYYDCDCCKIKGMNKDGYNNHIKTLLHCYNELGTEYDINERKALLLDLIKIKKKNKPKPFRWSKKALKSKALLDSINEYTDPDYIYKVKNMVHDYINIKNFKFNVHTAKKIKPNVMANILNYKNKNNNLQYNNFNFDIIEPEDVEPEPELQNETGPYDLDEPLVFMNPNDIDNNNLELEIQDEKFRKKGIDNSNISFFNSEFERIQNEKYYKNTTINKKEICELQTKNEHDNYNTIIVEELEFFENNQKEKKFNVNDIDFTNLNDCYPC